MAKQQIPKYSAVLWAAVPIGAIIIGYLVGISSVSRNSASDGNSYMMLVYGTEWTYVEIENWEASVVDGEISSFGVFPAGVHKSEASINAPNAFIIISAESMEVAQQISSTFPLNGGSFDLSPISQNE